MSEQLDKKSILEMSMGAILERVDYEMGKVIDNILDLNTKPNAKRKITVTLELIPSADRKTITVQSTAKATLVPTDPGAHRPGDHQPVHHHPAGDRRDGGGGDGAPGPRPNGYGRGRAGTAQNSEFQAGVRPGKEITHD